MVDTLRLWRWKCVPVGMSDRAEITVQRVALIRLNFKFWCVPRGKYVLLIVQKTVGAVHRYSRIHSVGIMWGFESERFGTCTGSLVYLATFVSHFSAARVGGRIGGTVIVP
jgi:hypothetical protein